MVNCVFNITIKAIKVLIFLFLPAVGLRAQYMQIPQTEVRRCLEPPLVDGDLSDACWQDAVALDDFYIYHADGKTSDAVRALVAFDDEWLYFAFDIVHPDPEYIRESLPGPGASIASYDSLEIFVRPGAEKKYFQYMLSAGNIREGRFFTGPGRRGDSGWNVPWRSAARITDAGWQAEIALPLCVFAEHGGPAGMAFLAGVNRVIPARDESGAVTGVDRETLSSAPAPDGFHDPSRFVTIKGLENAACSMPLLVAFNEISSGGYQMGQEWNFFYTVSGSVDASRTGKVAVVVEDSPLDGKKTRVRKEMNVVQAADNMFSIKVPVENFPPRTAALVLEASDTGEILQREQLNCVQNLVMLQAYVRYSVYTDENEAQIVCAIGLPEDQAAGLVLVVRDQYGNTLQSWRRIESRTIVNVPLQNVSAGNHLWDVSLESDGGDVVQNRELRVVKREPAPGQKIFKAGAAQVDISPVTLPVIQSGQFIEQTAEKIHDRLMSRALVLDDETERIAIVVVDNLMMPSDFLEKIKNESGALTGIAPGRIMISATHTHSAPSVMGVLGSRADEGYAAFLGGKIVESILLATENLEPARIGWARIEDHEHNHCRRWILRPDRIMRDPFGIRSVRAMMHPGHQSPNHVGPSGPTDPELSLLSVQAADGRPMAVLGNYAMHYKGAPALSGDFCGRFGAALGELIGGGDGIRPFTGMMSQGTSGDSMWMNYAAPRQNIGLECYTDAVAEKAYEAYNKIVYHDWVPLKMAESSLELALRVPDEERLEWARGIAGKIGDRLPREQTEVYALEALYLHEQQKAVLPLQVIKIGELGITAIPNEVYGITGLKLKAQSPLEHLFNITLANGAFGYIPPPEQYFLGGYTTWPARTAGLEKQAEPKIVEQLLSMLEDISGAPRKLPAPASDNYTDMVMESRPAAFWRLDELNGPLAYDSSGNGRHASYEPGVAFYLPGRGADDLVCAERVPNRGVHIAGGRIVAPAPEFAGAYSFEFWFWNGFPPDARPVCGYLFAYGKDGDNGGAADQLMIVDNGEGKGVLRFANGQGRELAGNTPLRFRSWHHVVLTRENDMVKVFLDGSENPEIAGASDFRNVSEAKLFFGGRHDLENTFEGKLDDISVYDRPVTAPEVAKHFKSSGLK